MWFIPQGKMPPLGIQGLETVAQHGVTQDIPIVNLLLGEGCSGDHPCCQMGKAIDLETFEKSGVRSLSY